MGNSDKKVKGVADIVFLMDATGSMGNCIQRLKDNVMVFFRSLTEKVAGANSVVPIKDWRAKVVGCSERCGACRDCVYRRTI